MTPAEWIAYLINAIVACTALPIQESTLEARTYLIQAWVCQFNRGPALVRAWTPQCDTGHTKYWGRIAYVEFGAPFDVAIYRNRFGEFQIGEGAQVSDAYEGPCGS